MAFASNRDGDFEVYTLEYGTGNLVKVTDNGSTDVTPAWSFDDQHLVYVSDRDGDIELYQSNRDGSNPTRLTNNGLPDLYPTYSSDGQKIAWVRIVDDYHGMIFTMNADGTGERAITPPLLFIGDLDWEPDTNRLVFDFDFNGDGWLDLGIIQADGTGFQLLDSGGYLRDVLAGSWGEDGGVLCSIVTYIPSGGQLYVNSTRLSYRNVDGLPYDGGEFQSYSLPFNFYPDAAKLDRFAPVSQVHPLPEYSRVGGYPIEYSVTEVGTSGLWFTQLQKKVGSNGTWEALSPIDAILYSGGSPGEIEYYRSYAQDYAENKELMPIWPDAHTTPFVNRMDGKLSDSRGNGLAFADLTYTPSAINQPDIEGNGTYTTFFKEAGNHTLAVSADGYSSIFFPQLDLSVDATETIPMLPLENQITNGSFVYGSQDWERSGTLPVGQTFGGEAVSLGIPCSSTSGCFEELTQPITISFTSGTMAPILATGDGVFHAVYGASEYDPVTSQLQRVVRYTSVPVDGDWSQPLILYTTPIEIGQIFAGLGPDGRIHVLIEERATQVTYLIRATDGTWAQPEQLEWFDCEDIALAANGTLFVLYTRNGAYQIKERSIAGTWIDQPNYYYDDVAADLFTTPNGQVSIIYADGSVSSHQINQRIISSNNPADPTPLVTIPSVEDTIQMIVDAQNNQYLFIGPAGLFYKPAGGKDYQYLTIPKPDLYDLQVPVVIEGNGNLWVYASDYNTSMHIIRLSIKENKVYGEAYPIFGWITSGSLVLDNNHRLNLFSVTSGQLSYRGLKKASETANVVLSQTVQVPASIHAPTLAARFWVDYPGKTPGASFASIKLTSDSGTVELVNAHQRMPLSLAWLDMTPYIGQTVTIQAEVHQTAGEFPIQLVLEEVNLGPWLTPIVDQVFPEQITADLQGSTVTI